MPHPNCLRTLAPSLGLKKAHTAFGICPQTPRRFYKRPPSCRDLCRCQPRQPEARIFGICHQRLRHCNSGIRRRSATRRRTAGQERHEKALGEHFQTSARPPESRLRASRHA
jgi:hypothetical protein